MAGLLKFGEGGVSEKILLNLDIVRADVVKTEQNNFFFFYLTRVFKISSQAIITNRLCRKYNKSFRFVKVSSAIPLYVIEIK